MPRIDPGQSPTSNDVERDTSDQVKSRENSCAPAPLKKDAAGERPAPTGTAVKRVNTAADLIMRGLAFATAVVLVWFAYFAQPVQIADVSPTLNPSLYIGLLAVTAGGYVDHGSVPVQFTGIFTEAGAPVDMLELDTRPSGASLWQEYPACCTISGNSFIASASLSVASAPAFNFQLVSMGDNTVLATGTLTVHRELFPGGSQQAINIIAALGAAAVLLEFLRFAARRLTTPKPASPTRQGEPNAKER